MQKLCWFSPACDYLPCAIYFILVGDKGGVQAVVYTDWYTSATRFDSWNKGNPIELSLPSAVFTYHAYSKLAEDDSITECGILNNLTYSNTMHPVIKKDEEFSEAFIAQGDSIIWELLEDYYEEIFGERE